MHALQGPLTSAAEGFKNLITASNAGETPTTVLLRENILIAGKMLIHLRDHVQFRAANNAFVSLGDGVHFEANSPTVPVRHYLDHNTWAIRQTVFTLRAGPDFQAVGPVSMHANSNAFLIAEGPTARCCCVPMVG